MSSQVFAQLAELDSRVTALESKADNTDNPQISVAWTGAAAVSAILAGPAFSIPAILKAAGPTFLAENLAFLTKARKLDLSEVRSMTDLGNLIVEELQFLPVIEGGNDIWASIRRTGGIAQLGSEDKQWLKDNLTEIVKQRPLLAEILETALTIDEAFYPQDNRPNGLVFAPAQPEVRVGRPSWTLHIDNVLRFLGEQGIDPTGFIYGLTAFTSETAQKFEEDFLAHNLDFSSEELFALVTNPTLLTSFLSGLEEQTNLYQWDRGGNMPPTDAIPYEILSPEGRTEYWAYLEGQAHQRKFTASLVESPELISQLALSPMLTQVITELVNAPELQNLLVTTITSSLLRSTGEGAEGVLISAVNAAINARLELELPKLRQAILDEIRGALTPVPMTAFGHQLGYSSDEYTG